MPDADIEAFFERTLVGACDDDAPWEAVRDLHTIGTRDVFDKAEEWCKSREPLKRARGADVLGQLGKTAENPTARFADESFKILSALLSGEADARPLASAVAALGHLSIADAVPVIAQRRAHPNDEVRFLVAFALGCYPDDERSIGPLIELTRDNDSDVRDWATFGLGVLGKADLAEIRTALVERLDDADQDTREEAMVGLAMRHDTRVVTPLVNALQETPDSERLKEAACSLLGLPSEQSEHSGSELLENLKQRFRSIHSI